MQLRNIRGGLHYDGIGSIYRSSRGNKARVGGGLHYDGIGSIYQSSRGIRGFGDMRQRFGGGGFGAFLSKIFGKAVPFLKNRVLPALKPALSHVKNSLTDAAANIVEDVLQGENVVKSVKKNITSEGKKLIAKAPAAFTGILRRTPEHTEVSHNQTTRQAPPNPSTARKKRKKVSFAINPKRARASTNSRFPALSRL